MNANERKILVNYLKSNGFDISEIEKKPFDYTQEIEQCKLDIERLKSELIHIKNEEKNQKIRAEKVQEKFLQAKKKNISSVELEELSQEAKLEKDIHTRSTHYINNWKSFIKTAKSKLIQLEKEAQEIKNVSIKFGN